GWSVLDAAWMARDPGRHRVGAVRPLGTGRDSRTWSVVGRDRRSFVGL
ncbi:MAG: hypothetical protein AVDCRST_MAG49-2861, partial [uncultured Thermomicrobiales bacterium]